MNKLDDIIIVCLGGDVWELFSDMKSLLWKLVK